MRKAGNSQERIAHSLGVAQPTISKELKRNRGLRGYRPKQAQEKALHTQKSWTKRCRVIVGETELRVRERLARKHSPDQISGALRREGEPAPSRTAIYDYIQADRRAGGTLYLHLRINGKRRYRHRNRANRHKLPNRVDIEKRPAIANNRLRYGDWEADLICGGNSGYLLSLYERKSLFGKLVKLHGKDAAGVTEALIATLTGYRVHTITYDNGMEFAGHEQVSAALGAAGYFCKPYHSWEKGGVENYNGLVRQYLPKGTNLAAISEEKIFCIECELNERPRKKLKYNTPLNLKHILAA